MAQINYYTAAQMRDDYIKLRDQASEDGDIEKAQQYSLEVDRWKQIAHNARPQVGDNSFMGALNMGKWQVDNLL